jgi:hypothetical protein
MAGTLTVIPPREFLRSYGGTLEPSRQLQQLCPLSFTRIESNSALPAAHRVWMLSHPLAECSRLGLIIRWVHGWESPSSRRYKAVRLSGTGFEVGERGRRTCHYGNSAGFLCWMNSLHFLQSVAYCSPGWRLNICSLDTKCVRAKFLIRIAY